MLNTGISDYPEDREMSEEKKGAARLDTTSTDAMHWAECFCEQVEINSKDEVHIEPEFLVGYFANFWAAVHDPLQNTIEQQQSELSALSDFARFAKSCIQSGEPWTEQAQAMYDKALLSTGSNQE